MLRKKNIERLLVESSTGRMVETDGTELFLRRVIWSRTDAVSSETVVTGLGYEMEHYRGNGVTAHVKIDLMLDIEEYLILSITEVDKGGNTLQSFTTWCSGIWESKAYIADYFGLNALRQVIYE